MNSASLFRGLLCFGMASIIAIQPAAISLAHADPKNDGEKEVAELDAILKARTKEFKYLDAKGSPVEYGQAITDKKPFFIVPTGPAASQYQKDRIIGLIAGVKEGKIVLKIAAYDISKGFENKHNVGAAEVVLGGDGGQATIDSIEKQMKVITSNVIASVPTAPGDRKVASGSCIETKIINQVLVVGGLAALGIIGSITYGIMKKGPTKPGFMIYRFYALAGTGLVVGVVGTVARIVRYFRCDEVEGF